MGELLVVSSVHYESFIRTINIPTHYFLDHKYALMLGLSCFTFKHPYFPAFETETANLSTECL